MNKRRYGRIELLYYSLFRKVHVYELHREGDKPRYGITYIDQGDVEQREFHSIHSLIDFLKILPYNRLENCAIQQDRFNFLERLANNPSNNFVWGRDERK